MFDLELCRYFVFFTLVRNQTDCSKMTQEMMKKDEKDNPWDVNSLDVFCNYNCPECDFKDSNRLVFRDHAVYEHAQAKLIWSQHEVFTKASVSYSNKGWTMDWESESDVGEDSDNNITSWESEFVPDGLPDSPCQDSEKKTLQVLEVSTDPDLSKIKIPGAKKVRVMKVTKQSNGQLLCKICSGIFEDVNGVVKHMPHCKQVKPNATFKPRKDPEKEFNLNYTPINPHCSACDLTFANQKGIDDHYKDPKCVKIQQLKQNMKKSDNIPTETEGWSVRAQNVKRFGHDKYKPMICKNCKEEFPTRDLLDKHFGYSDMCDKLLHAPPRIKKERRFCCDSCGESFVTEHRFRR